MALSYNLGSCGFDRMNGGILTPNITQDSYNLSDGLVNANIYGTPTPNGLVKFNNSTGPDAAFWLEEYNDSPVIEIGEQSTIVHTYKCDPSTAQLLLINNQRGQILTDSQGYIYRVLTSRSERIDKGNACKVTITSEAQFNPPPEEFTIEPVELNPSLDKHARYGNLTYKDRYIVRQANINDNADLAQQYTNALVNITNPTELQQAKELLLKRHKGQDSFYLAGWKITWSKYFWTPQILNPGGYIEDPVVEGGVPYYFWSDDGTPDGNNIFAFASDINPNMFPENNLGPTNTSWLRQGDQLSLQRTWWRLSMTWIGCSIGHWDFQTYTADPLPYQTSDTDGSFFVL